MTVARSLHAATLLPNGKVLITGGFSGTIYLDAAELYDRATDTFTATSWHMIAARGDHTATLLSNGKVLVTGGYNGSSSLITAELYDPAVGSFALTATDMSNSRQNQTATLLLSGKVLVAGGYTDSANLYDIGLGYSAGRQPVISTISAATGKLVLSGTGFRGDSEGSSGNTGNASSGIPVLQVQRVDGGALQTIRSAPTANWSSTSFVSSSLSTLGSGHYLATVIADGVPGNASIFVVGSPQIGLFRPSTGMWYLDSDGNGGWSGCGPDGCIGPFGMAGDYPVVGDWTGTGTTKIGVFRPSTGMWYLDSDGSGGWSGCGPDGCFGQFGMAGDLPVVGSW